MDAFRKLSCIIVGNNVCFLPSVDKLYKNLCRFIGINVELHTWQPINDKCIVHLRSNHKRHLSQLIITSKLYRVIYFPLFHFTYYYLYKELHVLILCVVTHYYFFLKKFYISILILFNFFFHHQSQSLT